MMTLRLIAAGLFGGSGGDIAAGVILAILLPLAFLVCAALFIGRMLHSQKYQKAGFVITPELEEKRGSRLSRGIRAFQGLLLGRESPEGFWRTIRKPDSRFVYKWGALFEETRGPPMLVHGATWEAHPVTGFVNRGRLIPVPGAPIVSFRCEGDPTGSCSLCHHSAWLHHVPSEAITRKDHQEQETSGRVLHLKQHFDGVLMQSTPIFCFRRETDLAGCALDVMLVPGSPTFSFRSAGHLTTVCLWRCHAATMQSSSATTLQLLRARPTTPVHGLWNRPCKETRPCLQDPQCLTPTHSLLSASRHAKAAAFSRQIRVQLPALDVISGV